MAEEETALGWLAGWLDGWMDGLGGGWVTGSHDPPGVLERPHTSTVRHSSQHAAGAGQPAARQPARQPASSQPASSGRMLL